MLTKIIALTGTVIKQGDSASRMRFALRTTNDTVLNGPAKVQLINDQNQAHEVMVDVTANHFELGFAHALPVGVYRIEVEMSGYVFPSQTERTVTVRENLADQMTEELITLKRLSVEEEVQRYLSRWEAGQIDLDLLMERLTPLLPKAYDDSGIRKELAELKTRLEEVPRNSVSGSGRSGLSAYELAQMAGFSGSLTEWLVTLRGDKGEQGLQGKTGQSAYEVAVSEGYEGDRQSWLVSLKSDQMGNIDGGNASSRYDHEQERIDGGYAV